jgi:EF hand
VQGARIRSDDAREAALTEDRLGALRDAEEGVGPAFAEIDADGDGAISREEWSGFGDRRFSGAAAASDGRMSVEDYDRWRKEGMPP